VVINEVSQSDLYTYRVTWSEEDKEFIGLCAEFPSLSWLAETKEAAIKGITDIVSNVIIDMESNDETIPAPLSTRSYSGNLSIRIPPEIHRKLAIQAAESNISINRLISVKLAAD
jgi:predicted HicB family RNase H-like nuclease